MIIKAHGTKDEARSATENGITLLLTIVILSALLSMSIGIFNVVLGQIKISGDLHDSFIAYYAATNAMEKMLYLDRNLGICTGGASDPCREGPIDITSGGCYRTRVIKSGGDTTLETVGQYRCGVNPSRIVKRRLFLTYVSPGLPSPPTADIKANGSDGPIIISAGDSATISWSSTNTTSCTVTPPGWTGTSGSQSTGSLTASQTYNISCTGPGGSTSDNVVVSISAPPAIAFDTALSTNLLLPPPFTITTAQPNEVVLLGIMVSNGAGGIPPTATLDGVAMTPIQTVAAGTGSTGFLRLFWGVAVSAGSHTITPTISFSGGNGWSATAIALQNVNTTSPVDTSGGTGATSASITTTVANTWLVSVGGYSSATFGSNISFGASFTERIDSLVPAEVAIATQPAPTAGFYSTSWTPSTVVSGTTATIFTAVKP